MVLEEQNQDVPAFLIRMVQKLDLSQKMNVLAVQMIIYLVDIQGIKDVTKKITTKMAKGVAVKVMTITGRPLNNGPHVAFFELCLVILRLKGYFLNTVLIF